MPRWIKLHRQETRKKNPYTEKEDYHQYITCGGAEVMLDKEVVDTVANCVPSKCCPRASSIRYLLTP